MSNPKRIKLAAPENYSGTMYPVLQDDLIEDTPLVDVFVDTIKNPKDISKVIVDLNSRLPIPELSHLKRVRAKEILLFPVENMDKKQVNNILKTKGIDTSLLSNEVRIASVARIPPRTRKQYTRVHEFWPCNFHNNKYTERLVTNTLFTEHEILEHEKYMTIAVEVAVYAKKMGISQVSRGVIVVDPKIKSIVGLGYSEASENPCKHAPMVAIDSVARTQNGGAWNLYESPKCSSDLNLDGIHPILLPLLKEKFSATSFGASWFKGKSDIVEPSDGPYLCTDYYAYLTHEPCIMCAMALVHSRVKRVFYGAESNNGGLGTLCKIHTVKDLNHHYEVFAKLCEDKCKLLND